MFLLTSSVIPNIRDIKDFKVMIPKRHAKPSIACKMDIFRWNRSSSTAFNETRLKCCRFICIIFQTNITVLSKCPLMDVQMINLSFMGTILLLPDVYHWRLRNIIV